MLAGGKNDLVSYDHTYTPTNHLPTTTHNLWRTDIERNEI